MMKCDNIFSVPIHVELCVIHAEILTIAHVLSTTHVHSRTFFRTKKRYFHRTTLLGCYFDQLFHCVIVFIVLLSRKIEVTMSILLLFGRTGTLVSFRTCKRQYLFHQDTTLRMHLVFRTLSILDL